MSLESPILFLLLIIFTEKSGRFYFLMILNIIPNDLSIF